MQDVWFYIRYWIAALLFILGSWLSSCQPEAFDTAPYESYVLYDGCLTCLDWGEEASASVTYVNRTYNVTFCKVKDESEDQFIYAKIKDRIPLSFARWCVLQNPENYVDIWLEWTVAEIQIFKRSDTQIGGVDTEPERIISVSSDADCARELSAVNQIEADTVEIPASTYLNTLGIRVIFRESETIIWESTVEYLEDSETGETIVCVITDDTHWEGVCAPNGQQMDGIYFDYQRVMLSEMPNLQAFLVAAREAYLETN